MELRQRQVSPTPDVEFSEVWIPNPDQIGTGEFRFQLKNNSLVGERIIVAGVYHEPIFQITATANVKKSELAVLIGRADVSDPISGKAFALPENLIPSETHEFTIQFQDWVIQSALMSGAALEMTMNLVDESVESTPALFPNWVNEGDDKKEVENQQNQLIFRLHPSTITDPRQFNDDEKQRVLSCIEFDLPYSIPYLQGMLPPAIRFPNNQQGIVLLVTRQKERREILNSMGWPSIAIPPNSVLVCNQDRHGRVNRASDSLSQKMDMRSAYVQSLLKETGL
jgi:hypothetical protein